jgi:hypothetical protein|nr:MAG TPA: hypothetical protein [Caudoviricetes sp.]
MYSSNQIESVFESIGCKHDNLIHFEEWFVNEDGDIINSRTNYPIYSHNLKRKDIIDGKLLSGMDYWLSVLLKKSWINYQCLCDFKKAYAKAIIITNKHGTNKNY